MQNKYLRCESGLWIFEARSGVGSRDGGDDDDRWLMTVREMRRSSPREKVLGGTCGRFCGAFRDVRILGWESGNLGKLQVVASKPTYLASYLRAPSTHTVVVHITGQPG